MATLLARLFAAPLQRDGMAGTLEAPVTGFSPAALDATAESAPAQTRRARPLDGGADALAAVVATKVLHGWLQNRHQTLFPLTVNLRTLDAAGRATLAALMAVALLADPGSPATRTRARDWLLGAGADEAMLDRLDHAYAEPPALSTVLDAVTAQGLSAYAYVTALIATPATAAGAHFLDYLAARLNLPNTVIRSATRRYRL